VPDLYPRVSQDPAKTGRHECSSSRLCTAAPVQTISKSHSLVFCVVGISIADGRWGTQWCRRCAINKTSSPASAAVIAVQSVYDADQVRQLRGRTSTAAWQREAVQVTTAQMVGRGSCCTNWKMCDLWGIGCLCKMTASANNIFTSSTNSIILSRIFYSSAAEITSVDTLWRLICGAIEKHLLI